MFKQMMEDTHGGLSSGLKDRLNKVATQLMNVIWNNELEFQQLDVNIMSHISPVHGRSLLKNFCRLSTLC